MKSPGTLVSYSRVRRGMSAVTLGLAITISMAPTGHASAQRPWPMHFWGFTMAALPPMTASTLPSGQTSTQAPQPMQCEMSMWGCCARGPPEKSLPRSAAASASRSRRRVRRICSTSGPTRKRPMTR